MAIKKEDILKALSTVDDPDLKQDLVTLNMVRNVEVEEKVVKFTLVLTTPACPLKEFIKNSCIEAIHKLVDKEARIFIEVTAEVTTQTTSLPSLPHVKNIIAVASGKGGVGKSTVTANLAVALAKSGAKVGLIDADIYGPSIPTMFNCEFEQPQVVQIEGKNMIIPIEQYGVKLISIGFLSQPGQAIVWRGPMASSALRQFITDTAWDELDYLIIDMPPGTGDIHLTLVQTIPVTGAIIVTTPQKVALSDAKKGLAMFKQPNINVPVLGVVENMSYFTPEELPDNKYYIFGKGGGQDLADKFGIPLLGQIPLVQGIRESGDVGYPVVMKDDEITAKAFRELAENIAQQVAIRNATLSPGKPVAIKE